MDDKEFEIERTRLKHNREKFWVGSVVVALTLAIINWQFQLKDIEVKLIEQENGHLARFVDQVIDKDPKTRLFVAEYFQTLSYSENARVRWSKYTNLAQGRLQAALDEERRKRELEVNIQEIYLKLINPETPPEERKSLQSNLLAAQIDIEKARERIALLGPENKPAAASQLASSDYDWLSVAAQVQSQAICTSLGAQTHINSFIQAVARPQLTRTLERYQGGDDAITCNQVCAALDADQSGATGPASCFGGVHVYSQSPPFTASDTDFSSTDDGIRAFTSLVQNPLQSFIYDARTACEMPAFGANYCCCSTGYRWARE